MKFEVVRWCELKKRFEAVTIHGDVYFFDDTKLRWIEIANFYKQKIEEIRLGEV